MKYKFEIKWAAIFFVVTLLWMLFEKMMGWHGPRIAQHASYNLLYDILFVLIYTLAFWDRKRSLSPQEFTWRQGFRFGLGMTVIVTALSPIVQVITHRLISPEFFPNIINLAVDNELLTPDEAQARFNLGNYVIENIIGTFILGVICSFILASVFSKKNLAVIVGLIVGAASYWFNPYNDLYLFGIHIYLIVALGTFAGSLILSFFVGERAGKTALYISLGVLLAVLTRIFYDLAQDPSTHNLFPFEILIVLSLTIPSAFAGSYLPYLIGKLKSQ